MTKKLLKSFEDLAILREKTKKKIVFSIGIFAFLIFGNIKIFKKVKKMINK